MRFWKVAIPLVSLALLLPASSDGRIWWSGKPQSGSYQVQIIVDGSARSVYYHRGHTYIEGTRGDRYVIRVHNRTWRRVEAVISVDGRDVIDGKSSTLGKRGYVIPPHSYVDVDGFRLSMNDVAAFRFTDVPDSYASRMGTPWNVGIIGVAVFPERVYRPRPRPRPPDVAGGRERQSPPRGGGPGGPPTYPVSARARGLPATGTAPPTSPPAPLKPPRARATWAPSSANAALPT